MGEGVVTPSNGSQLNIGYVSWGFVDDVNLGNLDAVLAQILQLKLPGKKPYIEIFAKPNEDKYAIAVSERAADKDIGVVNCGFFSNQSADGTPGPHMASSDPEKRKYAVAQNKLLIDFTALSTPEGDRPRYGGPFHTRHQEEKDIDPKRVREYVVQGLREVGLYAADKGVFIGPEILNTGESQVLNTVDETLDVIREVDLKNVNMHIDTAHLYQTETDFLGSWRRALDSGKTGHIHISEDNRECLGRGNVMQYLHDIFRMIILAKYQDVITFETFVEAFRPFVGLGDYTRSSWTDCVETTNISRNALSRVIL